MFEVYWKDFWKFSTWELVLIVTAIFFFVKLRRLTAHPSGRINIFAKLFLWGTTVFKESRVEPLFCQDGVQDLLHVHYCVQNAYFFDWARYFPHVAHCIRLKKYHYSQITSQVINDKKLACIVKQVAENIFRSQQPENHDGRARSLDLEIEDDTRYNHILREKQNDTLRILIQMRSRISDTLLRLTSWILYKLLPRFLSGVITKTNQIEMLKMAAIKSPNTPLVFLPLHRSHLDYILISFILLNHNIKSPLVAAGDNLKIPFFGSILRGLGAFFIKRKLDPSTEKKDILYRTVLQLYLQHAMEAGHNLEFFVEGGRTRTGKPCMPKKGLLSIIVSAFMDGAIPDALLVPVSVNYEKLVDGNFVHELLGQKKQPETFKSAALAIWKVLNSKYGIMRIDFNTPFSLRELIQSFNERIVEDNERNTPNLVSRKLQHNQSTSSLYGTDVVCEEHRKLVENISRHILYDCTVAMSIMATNAVSFILLTHFREGAYDTDIANELDELRNDLNCQRDLGFSGNSLDIVSYACHLLGNDLVESEPRCSKTFFKPNIKLPHVLELAYYSNSLVPFFALESVIVIALENTMRREKTSNVSKKELKAKSLEYSDLLYYEFILSKPSQNIIDSLEQSIERLMQKELIKISDASKVRLSEVGRQKYFNLEILEDEHEDEFTEDDVLIEFPSVNLVRQKELSSVLAPIFCAYKAVACSLKILRDVEILESELVRICLKNLRVSFEEGRIPYAETVSTEYIKNALKLFEKMEVLQIYNEYGVKLYSLKEPYNFDDKLETFCDYLPNIY